MEILLVLGGGIGNMIQATPSIQNLHKAGHIIDLKIFPDSENCGIEELLLIPGVREIFVKNNPQKQYDYQLTGPFVNPVRRYNSKHYLSYKTNYKQPLPEATTYNNLVASIGVKIQKYETRINLPNAGPSPQNQDTVAFFTGSKTNWLMKRWDKYDKLAEHFLHVTVIGRETDLLPPPWIEKWNWPSHVEFFSGTLSEVAYYISKCKMFFGNDGGLSHIAGTCIPTFVIFGPTCHVKNKPFSPRSHFISSKLECQPCQWNLKYWKTLSNTGECPFDLNCIKGLSEQQVLKLSLGNDVPI